MAKPSIITGLDIGSSAIKTLVARKKQGEEELEVLGSFQEISAGIRRGVVVNASRVSEIISSLLKKAQNESGQKINSIYANIGGAHLYCTS